MTTICCISDEGPMSLDCCGLNTPVVSKGEEEKNQKDDDTYLEESSNSSNRGDSSKRDAEDGDDDDDSVAASVVSAVSDLVTGQLALELGAEIVRSASEVLFGQCQQEIQILRDIEFDEATDASSLYTDDTDDAEEMTLTGFVRIRRSFGRSTSSAGRKQVESIQEEAEVPETTIAEKAEKYANALAALQQKQAEALEEHHRLKGGSISCVLVPLQFLPANPPWQNRYFSKPTKKIFLPTCHRTRMNPWKPTNVPTRTAVSQNPW